MGTMYSSGAQLGTCAIRSLFRNPGRFRNAPRRFRQLRGSCPQAPPPPGFTLSAIYHIGDTVLRYLYDFGDVHVQWAILIRDWCTESGLVIAAKSRRIHRGPTHPPPVTLHPHHNRGYGALTLQPLQSPPPT